MTFTSIIVLILVGAVAGWLAGLIVRGRGAGFLGNMVVGIVGAFLAGLILPRLGLNIGGGLIVTVIHATLGAVILLVLVGLVSGRR